MTGSVILNANAVCVLAGVTRKDFFFFSIDKWSKTMLDLYICIHFSRTCFKDMLQNGADENGLFGLASYLSPGLVAQDLSMFTMDTY